MKIFSEGTSGCELPFDYTTPVQNEKVTDFRKSINDALASSKKRFVNGKDKVFAFGGVNVYLCNNTLGRFVKVFTSETSRKTAEQYYNAEVSKVNEMISQARQAGLI
jgi:hypothetical protein